MNTDNALRPFPNSYWLIPRRLLAGEYPGEIDKGLGYAKLIRLLDCGIDYFLDLTEAGEMPDYSASLVGLASANDIQVYHQRMPVLDFAVPTPAQMRAILDRLDQALSARRNVYLHCRGGAGRTGTVVGCFLVRRGMQPESALQHIVNLRSVIPADNCGRSPETPAQMAFVLNWKERTSYKKNREKTSSV